MLPRTQQFLRASASVRSISARTISSLKACIVGAGPAGYYTAQRLLKRNDHIHIDIIDRLPVPFGLVRFGVAPDHPEVKNAINTFTQTATGFGDRCRFIGNVEVGKDVRISELEKHYDILVMTYGAENDRKFGIPGEDAPGVYAAREFVGWYNGLPKFADLAIDLSKAKSAVVFGQGNVALDIARLLLMPIDKLAKTDICQHALDAIAASTLSSIHIVGRRGPLQASFTIKEFRELTKLPGVQGHVPSYAENINIDELPRPKRRVAELMKNKAGSSGDADGGKSWHLDFLLTPREVLTSNGRVSALRCTKNKLVGDDIMSQRAEPTDESHDISCDLIVRSIGYQSRCIDERIPFDTKTYTIPNEHGRVVGKAGLYCSGWVKRGPVGVLASTMTDAFDTADSILEDIDSGLTSSSQTGETHHWSHSLGKDLVDFTGWENINQEEISRGENKGKPREKIVNINEMLRIAKR
ncbi:NADPH:adrenodoxin oxidoreductase, mitochondrial-like [Watersipora subatra]|uniref:NADPH:adrenodoxin oxidoreductase, mitochondrial-like n=1 Tax=Watersipora subatra TaxID=2589382 RepID=UPI00355BF1E4